MTSQWIDIPSFDGKTFKAWLALPSQTPCREPTPGLVVLQEIWGVNAHIRAVAAQYASDGYVVLAPDLFWRMQPRVDLTYGEEDTQQAFGFRKGIDLDLADRDIASTVAVLKAMPEVAGGTAAVDLGHRAAAQAGIDCAVCYYGGGIAQQLALAPTITVPMAMHFGDQDTHITPDQVASIGAALASHANVAIDTYAAADHGFNCGARPSYHQQSAALAHGRSLVFLASHLGRADV